MKHSARVRPEPSAALPASGPASPVSCTLAIKAIPNAPRNEVVGWHGDSLKVKIHAPPVEGRANDALREFLADTLRLPRRAVTVLRGDTSRQKLLRVDGLTLAEVKGRLLSG
jgi:uncharacterized protein (TIGR00251 family)